VGKKWGKCGFHLLLIRNTLNPQIPHFFATSDLLKKKVGKVRVSPSSYKKYSKPANSPLFATSDLLKKKLNHFIYSFLLLYYHR
jgi:hypothetical protein